MSGNCVFKQKQQITVQNIGKGHYALFMAVSVALLPD